MISVEEAQKEVRELLKARFPKARVSRVDVEESSDSDGEPSIKVKVVFRARPAREYLRYERSRLVDAFRTWLASKSDDRFPYFTLVSEQDEKELAKLQ